MQDGPTQPPMARQTYALEAGALTLTARTRAQPLFRVAERINPKRAFLFVSTVLGRHIPVDPALHRAALDELARGVAPLLLPGPVFVMGFAETAVGIGAGVFDCLRLAQPQRKMGYLTTTRFSPDPARTWFTIEESHSHAVDHIILRPDDGVVRQGSEATLVLVDDETTTGKTFAELATGLRAQGLHFGRVVLVTLTDWSDGRARSAVGGIFPDADVQCVSLQQGSWDWTPKPGWTHGGLPGVCDAACPAWTPDAGQPMAAPRTGISTDLPRQTGEDLLARAQAAGLSGIATHEKVLIVGAGEHVWQPMLVAEALGARGIYTRFITTTRSPILQGETIRQKCSFPDHYGEGFWMYMHNVVPGDWDRIVLFTETGAQGVPPELIRTLGRVDVIDGDGGVTVMSAQQVGA